MKKLFAISTILISLLFSCNKDTFENEQIETRKILNTKIKISDNELSILLFNDKDFSSFISEKKKSLNELADRINNLSKESKLRLNNLSNKYKSAENFLSIGSNEDIEFFSKIINYNPKAINHLKNALQKFKKYDLSPIFIISLIEKYLYPNPNLQFTAKKPKDCTKFMIEVYLWQYSAGTNMNGYDPTTADRQATVAASWVYVGCVYGAY